MIKLLTNFLLVIGSVLAMSVISSVLAITICCILLSSGCAIQIGGGNRILASDGKAIEAFTASDIGQGNTMTNEAEIGTVKE